MQLDDLVTALREDKQLAQHQLAVLHEQAEKTQIEIDVLAARIQGIEEARAALAQEAARIAQHNGDAMTPAERPPRRPRRDIRAMVMEYLSTDRGFWSPATVAGALGCRRKQVEKALKDLDYSIPTRGHYVPLEEASE